MNIIEEIKNGRKDLRGANLSEADLRWADLRWANLRWADLSGADLREADLREADLRWANLREADLRWANLWDVVGDSVRIITMTLPEYTVNLLDGEWLQIGCKKFTVKEWFEFDDNSIASMDRDALVWWKKWRPLIEKLVEEVNQNGKE